MIENIKSILINADYKEVGNRLSINDFTLEFDSILQGPNNAIDLVLIENKAGINSEDHEKAINELIKKMDILSLLLTRAESTRVLNLIYIGQLIDFENIRKLEGFCRVTQIFVDSINIEQLISSLLPLNLPNPIDSDESAVTALKNKLGNLANNKTIIELIEAAAISSEKVEEIAFASLESIIKSK